MNEFDFTKKNAGVPRTNAKIKNPVKIKLENGQNEEVDFNSNVLEDAYKKQVLKCEICKYTTTYSSHMLTHKRKHNGHTPHKCSSCPAQFRIRSDLVRHNRIHSGEKPYGCDKCSYRCAIKSNLSKHNAFNHNPEDELICIQCGFKTSSRRSMNAHARQHVENHPFACTHDKCDHVSTSRVALAIHQRVHSGIRPFQCKYCDYTAKQSGNVRLHLKRKHADKAPHEPVRMDGFIYRRKPKKEPITDFSFQDFVDSHEEPKDIQSDEIKSYTVVPEPITPKSVIMFYANDVHQPSNGSQEDGSQSAMPQETQKITPKIANGSKPSITNHFQPAKVSEVDGNTSSMTQSPQPTTPKIGNGKLVIGKLSVVDGNKSTMAESPQLANPKIVNGRNNVNGNKPTLTQSPQPTTPKIVNGSKQPIKDSVKPSQVSNVNGNTSTMTHSPQATTPKIGNGRKQPIKKPIQPSKSIQVEENQPTKTPQPNTPKTGNVRKQQNKNSQPSTPLPPIIPKETDTYACPYGSACKLLNIPIHAQYFTHHVQIDEPPQNIYDFGSEDGPTAEAAQKTRKIKLEKTSKVKLEKSSKTKRPRGRPSISAEKIVIE